ncbi:regucalcin [Bemisia tabaci]|uniref:regucalcin n=1 Tax=Bemisia tabaci TaxID=7038 RepID=UPI003B27D3A5
MAGKNNIRNCSFLSVWKHSLRCWMLLFPLMSLGSVQAGKISMRVVSGPFDISEEPHYDCQNKILLFVDKLVGKICIYNPQTGCTTCSCNLGEELAGVIPIQDSRNEFLAGLGPKLVKITWNGRPECKPQVVTLGRFDYDAFATFSDGKADCTGRTFMDTKGKMFCDGTMVPYQASIFQYDRDYCNLKIEQYKDATFYNGLAWNTKYTRMYLCESLLEKVFGFDYDIDTGKISE